MMRIRNAAINLIANPFIKLRNKWYRRKVKKIGDISIVSNNCLAGFVYSTCGLRFCSPTINLQMSPADFVKFVQNFEHYLSCELLESPVPHQELFSSLLGGEVNFPVGILDDIVIFFQHFPTFSEAKEKWEIRKKRINFAKLFFVLVATDCPLPTLLEFEKAPFKNKLILCDEPIEGCPSSFAMHNGAHYWFDPMDQAQPSQKYYEQFDFMAWFARS